MTKNNVYLAIDLGAGSGRVLAGECDGESIAVHEVYRFENTPLDLPDGCHWNIGLLYQSILAGLKLAAETYGERIVSLGVDSWGVDYALFDADGRMLGLPYHYRDKRTDGMMEAVFAKIPKAELYRATGIQFMSFNTVFQLAAEAEGASAALAAAEDLLFIPHIITYWLTGKKIQERSMASTTQLYDPVAQDWDFALVERLGLPRKLFKPLLDPGYPIGTVSASVRELTGLGPVQVVAVAGHDTANAVAAVPSAAGTPAYLSSGTWSLIGLELKEPVISEASFADAFTNEIGLERRVRFLKNLCGLWLAQESRRHWLAEGVELSYAELSAQASEATPFRAFVNPDAPVFAAGGRMPEKIQSYCRDTGQAVPSNPGEIVRCIYESLALRCAQVWEMMKKYSPEPLNVLHVVGGGAQDQLLNQLIANAIGAPLLSGPVEATGLGNVVTQAIAAGELKDLAEARSLISASARIQRFEPQNQGTWTAAKARFATLTEGTLT